MAVSALADAEKKLRTHALSFKLGEAAEEVLHLPFTAPSDWIEDSYRLVAPKKLIARLQG
jgi:hypothetical protein